MTSYWSGKRVVVTGGGGFIGTAVVHALRNTDCEEIFVVRSSQYDLTIEEQVRKLFQQTQPNIVIHLAGLVGSIISTGERPANSFYENLLMGTYVFHHAWLNQTEQLVATIAGCDYPDSAPLPFAETNLWDGRPQIETASYSLAKRLMHVQAGAYYSQHGFRSVILIPGNTYGPHDSFDPSNSRVIAALIKKFMEAKEQRNPQVEIWGSGQATRDFIFVDDLARGILMASEKGDSGELFNVSSGVETSIQALAELIAELTGFKGHIKWNTDRPEGQLRRYMDTTKSKQYLGFIANTDLREGLQRTIKWFKENRTTVARSL